MAAPAPPSLFAVFFVGQSFPIPSAHFAQLTPTHWVLDVCTSVKPAYWELKEVALFLQAPNSLDPSLALGLYVKSGGSDWQYRGAVHNGHPSEVMPLQVSVGRLSSSCLAEQSHQHCTAVPRNSCQMHARARVLAC